MPPPPPRPGAPASLLTAVKIMYGGAAVSLLSVVAGLTQKDEIRKAIVARYPTYTGTQINAGVNVGLAFIVATGIIGLALWLWMASANKKGHPWARITGTVLFVINTLGLIFNLLSGTSTIQTLFAVVLWLVGLGAVVFLWRSDSSAYFNAS
jgi:hypothetical protein